jgi:hypothetical protein
MFHVRNTLYIHIIKRKIEGVFLQLSLLLIVEVVSSVSVIPKMIVANNVYLFMYYKL